jgi:hypothetical protein
VVNSVPLGLDAALRGAAVRQGVDCPFRFRQAPHSVSIEHLT